MQNTSAWRILQRVYGLLNSSERRRAAGLLAAVLVNSVVDLLGLAVVIPVIGLVLEPDLLVSNEWLAAVYDFAAAHRWGGERRFTAALCGVLVGAFLFKTVFGLWVNYLQTRFSFRIAHRMSGDLWMHHFSDSLEKLRSKESGRLLTEINSWPILFARVFITGGQLYFNELVVMALLAIGLTAYDPVVFLGVAGIIGTGAVLIRTLTKRQLVRNSETVRTLAPHTSSLVNNAIRGFLELITFRAVRNVRDRYLIQTNKLYRTHSNQMVLSLVPNRLYELLVVAALCGLIVIGLGWSNEMGGSREAFFATLSLLALSAYRVMPAMARINARMIAMRGQLHLLDAMESGTGGDWNATATAPSELAQPIGIEVRDLNLRYSTSTAPVVHGLNFRFEPGTITAITGTSGSGKSTLVSALLGLHAPESGSVWVGDQELGSSTLSVQTWLSHVAYLAQHPFLFAGTLRENLTLGDDAAVLDEARIVSLIDRLGLAEALGTSPMDFVLNEGGSNLSGGQQQRLALVRALQWSRPVLVLDEATSSLDTGMRDAVMGVLEEEASRGTTVLLVTHDEAIASDAQCLRLG